MTKTQNELAWFRAKLLPTAGSIFSTSFYPECDNGDQYVFCALSSITEQHNRVFIASRKDASAIRLLTPHLAAFCLSVESPVSEVDNTELNEIAATVISKFGCGDND